MNTLKNIPTEILQEMSTYLKQLGYKQQLPFDTRGGLCSNFIREFNVKLLDLLGNAVREWPYYSGDIHYPIPGDVLMYHYYLDAYNNNNKWQHTEELTRHKSFIINKIEYYIQLRCNLCIYLAHCIDVDLESRS